MTQTTQEYDSFYAGEILRQLGGNRFIAMTGAKNFARDDTKQMIVFRIERNAAGINYVRITLNSMDLYDMEFISMRKFEMKIKSHAEGLYSDSLESTFTEHTGMYTRL
jgi:hypothetical protein